MKKSKMKEIALKVRRSFEQKEFEYERIQKEYERYGQIKDINLFFRKAKGLFPNVHCGITSLYIQKLLGTGKIVQGKYSLENHTFLLVDQTIIDITAD